MLAALGGLLVATLVACNAPTEPPPPPGGGQEFHLSFETFEETIEPILIAKGCDVGGDCHGGGIRGTFELSPSESKDVAFDFEQARLQVNGYDPEASPLLTKPLAQAAGGAPHSTKVMASTDDPDYQAILAWIRAGEFR